MSDKVTPVDVVNDFNTLLNHLVQLKPNDRSVMDRFFAIVITDIEKAAAVYDFYIGTPSMEGQK